ncbi:hypothetical protein EUTSA_v10028165mg [Eutrema salsugineum]|uniref:PAS domain-containing protein n=1 Tax=Eutrema salsugineum TaxID=72664 RepID=V4M3P8_EUTSA|nr:uncharacterized protein LOC18022998 [Eutrema salsugineum]ESQ46878.1 hypothetical protein EUTSA_v10028165mg [Eutrema salsugineum]
MEDDGKRRQTPVFDGVTNQDRTVISRIMQRFRPIAPKPTVGESSDDSTSCKILGRNRRSKRKYVRVRNKNISTGRIVSKKNGCDGENIKTDLGCDDRSDIVTLQLLPEKDNRDLRSNQEDQTGHDDEYYGSIVGLPSSSDRTVVESWLTVEYVSDTCTDLGGYHILELSRMHQGEERVMKLLEVDTCPWLVSDGSNRVYWVNRAYRRMIGASDEEVNIKVWLVVAMDLMEEMACMVELYGAMTCRVRVRYEPSTWRKENGQSESEVKMTVPCDVWRMESGGFAWRLDVESALRLGR